MESRVPAGSIHWQELDPDAPPRSQDFYYPPFGVELRYEIVPPDGYELVEAPSTEHRSFGPLLYNRDVEEGEDALVATFTLEWPHARVTPEQYAEIQEGLHAYSLESTERVVYRHGALIQWETGDLAGAAASYRRLAEAWPDEPLHKADLAQLLLSIGQGEAAHAWMEQAAGQLDDVDPVRRDLMLSYHAWMIAHNRLGHYLEPGYDRAGTIAAWERVIDNDPDSARAYLSLGIALRHDDQGVELERGHPDRAEGLEQLRMASEKGEGNSDMDWALQQSLVADRAYEEALEHARAAPRSATSAGTIVAALCFLEGVEAVLASPDWRAMDKALRSQAVAIGNSLLLAERHYAQAAILAQKAPADGDMAVIARGFLPILQGARPWEEHKLDASDPADVTLQYLSLGLAPELDASDLSHLFHRATTKPELEGLLEDYRAGAAKGMASAGGFAANPNAMADMLRSLAKARVVEEIDGDALVEVEFSNPAQGKVHLATYLLVKHGKSWRIRAGQEILSANAGAEALARLDRGEPEQALRWLEWLRADRELRRPEDPWDEWTFLHLLHDCEAGDEDRLRLAAATLHAMGSGEQGSIDILESALESGELDEATRTLVQRSLVVAYSSADELERQVALIETILAEHPDKPRPYGSLVASLYELGRHEDRLQAARDRLEVVPDDVAARQTSARALESLGRTDEAREIIIALDREGEATGRDLNQLAWLDVIEGRVDAATVRTAERAAELSKYQNSATLHTLACAVLERGELTRAVELVAYSAKLQGYTAATLPDHWWYVVARIAEDLGERDTATRIYQRIEEPEEHYPGDSWTLAGQRLELLGAPRDG